VISALSSKEYRCDAVYAIEKPNGNVVTGQYLRGKLLGSALDAPSNSGVSVIPFRNLSNVRVDRETVNTVYHAVHQSIKLKLIKERDTT
jgi:hypothetical protein